MIYVIYNSTEELGRLINDSIGYAVSRFEDFVEDERKRFENEELFIAGESMVILNLLKKYVTNLAFESDVFGFLEDLIDDEEKISHKRKIAVFDDIIARIDEAIDIKPYFKKLIEDDVDVLYFARHEDSVKRLEDLPIEIYRREK